MYSRISPCIKKIRRNFGEKDYLGFNIGLADFERFKLAQQVEIGDEFSADFIDNVSPSGHGHISPLFLGSNGGINRGVVLLCSRRSNVSDWLASEGTERSELFSFSSVPFSVENSVSLWVNAELFQPGVLRLLNLFFFRKRLYFTLAARRAARLVMDNEREAAFSMNENSKK